MKRIAVYCGSNLGIDEQYQLATQNMARALVELNIELVFGGGRVGLMGVLADSMLSLGGKVTGVIPKGLSTDEVAHNGVTTLITVTDMHERKAKMMGLADAIISLPGGIGTMDELFEAWTWYQLGIHDKRLGLFNVEGYFDGLIAYLSNMVKTGFLSQKHLDSLYVDSCERKLINKVLSVEKRGFPTPWISGESST